MNGPGGSEAPWARPVTSISELVSPTWDAVVVGGGHNGLSAAAYIARAGRRVLVLERSDRLGGACTLETPFGDPAWQISPCAYLVGLLHPRVIEELGLASRGLKVHLVDPHLWCPFEDGTSIALWDDLSMSAAAISRFAPRDVEGYIAYCGLFGRIRRALRSPERDTWIGDAPDRDAIESLLAHDAEAVEATFEASIADVLERYITDERLRTALHGQGIIGTYAGPRDRGTAAVHLMHTCGTMEGRPGAWGYVEGGMGRVSLAIAAAASAAGAALATGVEVMRVLPGEGVLLAGGELVRSRAVVSNADPKTTLAMCEGDVPENFRKRVDAWRCDSPVLKINCALERLPTFRGSTSSLDPTDRNATAFSFSPHRAMVTISTGVDATQAACEASKRGEPSPSWCELYFQSAYDPSVSPEGRHVMSVFAQYVPYGLSRGDWDTRREEIADKAISEVARFSPDIEDVILERQVLGPPDIERRIGSTGGHIFQGECLPDQMWTNRFAPRTAIPGLYLCGASTHPGGSVIAVNGRNAAMALLDDLQGPD